MTFHDTRLSELTYSANPEKLSQEQLITNHLPLVRKLAWHVNGRVSNAIEIEDLLQIGMVALIEAARTYEDRGFGFSNYAKLRVRGAMIDQLRKISNLSRAALSFRKKLRTVKERLSQELGTEPNEASLAKAMDMDPESFRIAMDDADAIDLKSMDEVYSDQNIWFEDKTEQADEILERSEMQNLIAEAIAGLPKREGLILQLYFVEEMNLEEIGKTLDIGAARVCQIKKAALSKLKLTMKDSI